MTDRTIPPVVTGAREYLRRGWQPVPIPAGQKAPRVKHWQKLRLTEAELSTRFRDGDNVGLLLGEPSNGLLDVDLDAPEGLIVAETWLPATGMIHGRTSKPCSHWWYVSKPAPKPEKFADIDGSCLVELRGTSQQTLVPPSRHPSGEAISWVTRDEPAVVGGCGLREAVAHVAACALVARHWPDPGSRHETSLALAGTLARAGWSEVDVLKFVVAVAQATKDEERKDREAAVKTTFQKFAAGEETTGAPRLSELLGQAVVERLRNWLHLEFRASARSPSLELSAALHREIREVVLDREAPAFDKRRHVARLVQDELCEVGRLLRTSDGRGFFFHEKERRLYDLEQLSFQHLLTSISGLSATENFFKFALDMLQARTSRDGTLAEVHTLAHFDAQRGLLAVSDGGGGVWLRESRGPWQYCHNGRNGLLFLTEAEATPWVPEFESNGRALKWFLTQFLFTNRPLSREEQQVLLQICLEQQFFPTMRRTRVIPTFLGPQGSGKTTAERMVGRLLVGREFDVTGVHRDREDAFVAAITNRVVLGLDNADSRIPWLADALARYATGERYRLRRLYTTNDEVSYAPRASLMLSSRDPQFNRPDVTERLLPFWFERPRAYMPEDRIYQELGVRRGAVMGALLIRLGEVADSLQSVPAQPVSFRMADYASFGWRVFERLGKSTEWLNLLRRLEKVQAEFASEGDGLITALAELLRRKGHLKDLTVGELFRQCRSVAEEQALLFSKNVQSFGKHLSSLRRVIELELGVKFLEGRGHARGRWISLVPRDGEDGGDGEAVGAKVSEEVGDEPA